MRASVGSERARRLTRLAPRAAAFARASVTMALPAYLGRRFRPPSVAGAAPTVALGMHR